MFLSFITYFLVLFELYYHFIVNICVPILLNAILYNNKNHEPQQPDTRWYNGDVKIILHFKRYGENMCAVRVYFIFYTLHTSHWEFYKLNFVFSVYSTLHISPHEDCCNIRLLRMSVPSIPYLCRLLHIRFLNDERILWEKTLKKLQRFCFSTFFHISIELFHSKADENPTFLLLSFLKNTAWNNTEPCCCLYNTHYTYIFIPSIRS